MAGAATTEEVLQLVNEPEERDVDFGRTARILLHKDDPRREIVLSWHPGRNRTNLGRQRQMIVKRGQTALVPIERARAWFGMFTIPFDLEDIKDENRRKNMRETFERERARTLLSWGDYPRPRKLSDGQEPIGPHRMPHIIVTVIDGNGSEWNAIDLHEIYRVGEFDVEGLRPSDFAAAAEAEVSVERELVHENKELRSKLSKLEGQMEILLSDRKVAKVAVAAGA